MNNLIRNHKVLSKSSVAFLNMSFSLLAVMCLR